jgi:hypothetical protein
MGNFTYGFRILWRIWREPDFAEKVRSLEAAQETAVPPLEETERALRSRSEALTLLAVLQREGRLVDFLKEPIASYSDAQVGAAVRDVHKGCSVVIERMFAPQPLAPAAEGSQVEVPKGYDPLEYRLVGNVMGDAPYQGTLCHSGWKATQCELPEWTGSDSSLLVIAQAEVEIK